MTKAAPKRRIARKQVTATCQFPFEHIGDHPHTFTYPKTTRPQVYCPSHRVGWVDEDGQKHGDQHRVRVIRDADNKVIGRRLIVEESLSDAEVINQLMKGGAEVTGEGRFDPKLYRAVKVVAEHTVQQRPLSLDSPMGDGDDVTLSDFVEPQPDEPAPGVLPDPDPHLILDLRHLAPERDRFRAAIARFLTKGQGWQRVAPWLKERRRADPVRYARIEREVALAITEARMLQAGKLARRDYPVETIEPGRSGRQTKEPQQ
jgi:hypothetical protein